MTFQAKLLTSAIAELQDARKAEHRAYAHNFHEVRDDLASDDWAERLRDQLGLGHLTGSEAEPRPVALMIYTLADVLGMPTWVGCAAKQNEPPLARR